MKIIVDTNIWYYLGQDSSLFEKVKNEPLVPSFVNIYELSKSDNIIDKEENSRCAIQKLFHYKENLIYEPPFIHLAKLNCSYEFDPLKEIYEILEFTSKFANGYTIKEEKKEDFRKWLLKIRADLQTAADFFNVEAEKIRGRIKCKKDHKNIDTFQRTSNLVNYFVESTTNQKCSLNGFDMNRVELLLKALDAHFKILETSKTKIKANDWFDFAILSYVQPEDKIWTEDKKLLRTIEEAGCGAYLYRVEK